jgi:hypothetical protein
VKEIAFVLAIGLCVALNLTILGLLYIANRATRWDDYDEIKIDPDTKVLWPKEDK